MGLQVSSSTLPAGPGAPTVPPAVRVTGAGAVAALVSRVRVAVRAPATSAPNPPRATDNFPTAEIIPAGGPGCNRGRFRGNVLAAERAGGSTIT